MALIRLAAAAILACATLLAADAWDAVRNIKSGAEIRVFKRGTTQPINANMDELTDDKLLVVVKKEQVAILRDQIDRIDARPPQTGSRVTKTTKSEVTYGRDGKPNNSESVNTQFGSKPDFETVYRRTAASGK